MPEWLIGAVSKTVVPYGYPGFESLSLRQKPYSPLSCKAFLFIIPVMAILWLFLNDSQCNGVKRINPRVTVKEFIKGEKYELTFLKDEKLLKLLKSKEEGMKIMFLQLLKVKMFTLIKFQGIKEIS